MSYVQISTRSEEHPNGINYYTKYLNEYVKESDWPFIKAFITHYLKEGEEDCYRKNYQDKFMKLLDACFHVDWTSYRMLQPVGQTNES